MLDFIIKTDSHGHKYLETPLDGKVLLTVPQLNKGMAFTFRERLELGLMGKLPSRIETLDEQVARAYYQCMGYKTKLEQNIYLNNLHDKNQVVFYALVSRHLEDMLSTIYTPTVGEAVVGFSRKYRQARGIYMSHPEQSYMESILDNRTNPEIDLVVITDGEAVLGIGDQGIGGMDIPIAKLMVYTLCAGINPSRTLPITLDVGTNNPELLNDEHYLGWRHKRLTGDDYFNYIDRVVQTIRHKLPKAFIHWEDFSAQNGQAILDRYTSQFCTFNDDIQGTGATALAAIIAAITAQKTTLVDQRIVIYGAGCAGTGVAAQLVDALVAEGLSEEEAQSRLWLLDRHGLLLKEHTDLRPAQEPYARDRPELSGWNIVSNINLLDVISNVKPTILIGTSAQAGAFDETMIQTMASHVDIPIVLPLSNPNDKVEATPKDLIRWTNGKIMLATGSPFEPVKFKNEVLTIAQCNNAKVFPGIGLGVIVAKPRLLSKGMLLAAAHELSRHAPILTEGLHAPLLPSMADAVKVSKRIAYSVANQAIKEELSELALEKIESTIEEIFWKPGYLPYYKTGTRHC